MLTKLRELKGRARCYEVLTMYYKNPVLLAERYSKSHRYYYGVWKIDSERYETVCNNGDVKVYRWVNVDHR